MDSMDNFRERFEALEQRTEHLKHQTHILARQARWWRGIACGLLIVGLVSLPLPSGTARDKEPTAAEYKGLKQRIADLEYKLEYVSGGPNEVVITGANLRIVNGLGRTSFTNGLGNLIVGYNESRRELPICRAGSENPSCLDVHTGSHNIVTGGLNNFSSYGGIIGGTGNEISGPNATAIGGSVNTASGPGSVVCGGSRNTASSGGDFVGGGHSNTASGGDSSVIGGAGNIAIIQGATVSGGDNNVASGLFSSVSGGRFNTASGERASVSGGENNTASGEFSSVSGGANRSAPGTHDWAAGPLFADN